MSDFQINDSILTRECDELAADILREFQAELAEDETLEDKRGEISDRIHEVADGHQWVIYNHHALMICAHCDTDDGEDFLSGYGMPDEPDIYKLATLIAFGEMRARIETEIERLLDDEEALAEALT